jgi:tRNA A-37 threonylcarbamoyl transferase component Bud32
VDALTLVRHLLRPEHAPVLDEALRRHPPQADGRIDLGVIDHLVRQGALDVGSLVEAASDNPVRPIPPVSVEATRRFAPIALLGAGAMGQVYLVHDTVLNRHVAFKVLDPQLARDRGMRERFHYEAQITAQLDHPSIVAVHDLEQGEQGTVSYSMKLVRGKTLQDWMGAAAKSPRDPAFSLQRRLEILLHVCDAIAYAHRRNVLHRDLKPENIMVGAFNQVLVMDWGIARIIGGPEEIPLSGRADNETYRTQVGVAIGTPAYMSPEQARGENESLDGRSDLYTLGLILQELLTLKRARKGATAAHTLYLAMEGERELVQPRARPHQAPRELVAVLDRATAREPDHRYASVEEFAEDLRRFLRDEPVTARPDTTTQRIGRWMARHRTTTLSLLLLLVASVVGLAFVGVAGAFAVNEVNRWYARTREARLEEIGGAVTAQARRIETELLTIEGHLQAIAGAAEVALHHPPPDPPLHFAVDFSVPDRAPPDLAPSRVYDAPISLEHPDLIVATGVPTDAVRDDLKRLAGLTPVLQRAVFDSLGAEGRALTASARAERIRTKPAPIVWSYAATQGGAMAGFPGAGIYPDPYDPRSRPWYVTAIGADGPVWSALDADEGGLGLLLTCAVAIRGPDGRPAGVAAVDLMFTHVIDTLLDPADLDGPVEAWLIDPDGRVIVRSSQKELSQDVPEDWRPATFSYPELLERMRAAPSGTAELALDGEAAIAIWRPVPTVGWVYLVTGDPDALL